MSKKALFSVFFAFVLCISFGAAAFAQEITGSIVGTVKDSNGAAVAGATVTVTDPTKNNAVVRTVTTAGDGGFSIPNLVSSVYDVSVEAPNFKKSVSKNIKLDVGARRSVDVMLAAGKIDETVTVQADAVSVNLSTPTSTTVINGDQVREIPINNRNFVQLVALAPGVSSNLADSVYVGTTNPDGQANTVQLAVNGGRSSQNTFTVDGADVTDRGSNLTIQAYPNVDSIGEFQVLRSLYPAESGRSGGGQVNIVTRSGTDKFHGSAFEFVRNEKLNANSFFNNQNKPLGVDSNGKAIRPPFRYNNFGWTLGGPIYMFNFGEHDPGDSVFTKLPKTYFFFAQEFRRDRRYSTLNSTVPDAALRQGVFPIPICLQATGTTCNTTLPAGTPLSSVATINPISQQYLNFIFNNLPLPTNPATYALSSPARGISNFRQEVLKIDTSITSKLSAYYRFENDSIPTLDANALFSSGSGLPGVSTTSTNSPGRTHTAQITYVASPNIIFVGRYTFGYGAILSSNVGTLALSNSNITPPLPFANQRDRVPTLTGTGFSNLQSFGPYDNFSWKQNVDMNLTWIFGRHTTKFGGVYSLYRKNENALAGNNEGIYSGFLTPGATSVVLAAGQTGSINTVRQQWANFLLGTNASFSQAHYDYTADLRQKAFEGYAQDEWRVAKNITLYYGVRYSFFGSPYDKNGRLSNFDPELFNPSAAPLVTGSGLRVVGTGNFCNGMIVNTQNFQGAPNGCTPANSPWGRYVVDVSKKDFAPRIGMAWDIFGKGTSSLRVGYGIYHEQTLVGTYEQNIGVNPPYQETCSTSGINISNPAVGCNLVASTTTLSVRSLEPHWKTPYMQHWSLDWQQQLGRNTLFTVGYYGSKGTHLIGATELNELRPGYAISLGATACAVGSSTTPTAPCQVAGTGFFSSAATSILDQIRPYRGYRSITMIQPRYNSNYNSLQVSAQHRFSGSSQVNLAYTWSKNLSDNQTDRSTAPQNTYDIRSDYGRAALDRKHVLSINYIYEIPYFRKQQGFEGKLLGGWQASGIIVYNTGLPFTITTSSYDPAGLGFIPAAIAGGRPVLLCNPNVGGAGTQQQFFNTACFQTNPPSNSTNLNNVPGSSPRGVVNGPDLFRVDFKMTKNIRFGESINLQLFGEAFNVFNKTNFNTLSTNVTSSTFGQVTGTRDPRQLQFGAKFNF